MSNSPDFRCPVCRARQALTDACRRCQADLRLVVRAHRRVAHLMSQQRQARVDGDRLLEQSLAAELRLLAPNPRCSSTTVESSPG